MAVVSHPTIQERQSVWCGSCDAIPRSNIPTKLASLQNHFFFLVTIQTSCCSSNWYAAINRWEISRVVHSANFIRVKNIALLPCFVHDKIRSSTDMMDELQQPRSNLSDQNVVHVVQIISLYSLSSSTHDTDNAFCSFMKICRYKIVQVQVQCKFERSLETCAQGTSPQVTCVLKAHAPSYQVPTFHQFIWTTEPLRIGHLLFCWLLHWHGCKCTN